jgi:hypothetical protein
MCCYRAHYVISVLIMWCWQWYFQRLCMHYVYNKALYTYINAWKYLHSHCKPLLPLCSWSGYWPAWSVSVAWEFYPKPSVKTQRNFYVCIGDKLICNTRTPSFTFACHSGLLLFATIRNTFICTHKAFLSYVADKANLKSQCWLTLAKYGYIIHLSKRSTTSDSTCSVLFLCLYTYW